MELSRVNSSVVPENSEGRAYTHPKTGTAKSPHRSAFDTPPFGACVLRMSCVVEISGFVLDSSRSYANWLM